MVGRCVGAKDYEQVEYYVKKLMKTAYIAGAVVNGLVLLSMPLALNIYSLTPETAELTKILVWIHCAGAIVMWPVDFGLFNGGIQDSVQCHSGDPFSDGRNRSLDSDDHGLDIPPDALHPAIP